MVAVEGVSVMFDFFFFIDRVRHTFSPLPLPHVCVVLFVFFCVWWVFCWWVCVGGGGGYVS